MKKTFSFRFDAQTLEAARRQAEKENRTLTNWIETVIRAALTKQRKTIDISQPKRE